MITPTLSVRFLPETDRWKRKEVGLKVRYSDEILILVAKVLPLFSVVIFLILPLNINLISQFGLNTWKWNEVGLTNLPLGVTFPAKWPRNRPKWDERRYKVWEVMAEIMGRQIGRPR